MREPTTILGLGTAAIGRPQYINLRQEPVIPASLDAFKRKGWKVLEEAYDQGVRYFDTAPGYGFAEKLLIDWVAQKDDASIEIATKWGYTYVANFDPNASQHEIKEHSLAKLDEQWKQSKALLPGLTTYQIHSATFVSGVLENVSVLERLGELKDKYSLLIGITTTGANQVEVLKKALDIEVNQQSLFDVFQVTYNIFDQSLASIAAEVDKQDKRLVIKEALANGRVFPNKSYPAYLVAYSKLSALAEKYGVGIDAIALRFCVDSITLYKVLSGAATTQHLSDNVQVSDFTLTEEDLLRLKKVAVSPDFYWSERKKLGWN